MSVQRIMKGNQHPPALASQVDSSRFSGIVTDTLHARRASPELGDVRPSLAALDLADGLRMDTVSQSDHGRRARVVADGADFRLRKFGIHIALTDKDCAVLDHVLSVQAATAPFKMARVHAKPVVANGRLVTGVHARDRFDTLADRQSNAMRRLLAVLPPNNTVALPLGRKRPIDASVRVHRDCRFQELKRFHFHSSAQHRFLIGSRIKPVAKRTADHRYLVATYSGGINARPAQTGADHG